MEEYIRLQQRNDEIWDLLEDPTISSLDQQSLNEELVTNSFNIMIIEDQFEYMTITPEFDEYDREGLIANDDFDLGGEI